jgi:Ca-activated chloride channel family protein
VNTISSAVAEFGMLLRNSSFRQQATFEQAYILAKNSLGDDREGYRKEFLQLLGEAGKLTRAKTTRETPSLSKAQINY